MAIPTANPLQIVGVSYVIPKGAFESPSFVHMGGRFLENIANDELGKFDLITDNFGPYSYTEQIDIILQKYIDLLNVGGSAFIQGMNIYSGGEPAGLTSSLLAQIPLYREHLTNRRLTIKTTSGRQTVLDWLRSHPGIRAETLDTWPNDAVVITKLVEEPVRLRRLKLSRFVKGTPPYRKYEELR